MKVKIEFELPRWTRWIVVGIVVGFALGYGVAGVRATPTADLKQWNPDDILTAEDLNHNFQSLQAAISAQQAAISALAAPDCPIGYSRDTTAASSIVLCKKGTDEMVRVGGGSGAFWIDRYEASVWDKSDLGGQQFGLQSASDYPQGFPSNGQFTTALYALSVAGVKPSVHTTWFQALAACTLSGKRLPSDAEWLAAAVGTLDAGSNDGLDGTCVTNGSGLRSAGKGVLCRSYWGAEDMIGNAWEWTAEWYAPLVGLGSGATSYAPGEGWWSLSDYRQDGIWAVGWVDPTGLETATLPVAAIRGGCMYDKELAGVFAISLEWAPSSETEIMGFRCVTSR